MRCKHDIGTSKFDRFDDNKKKHYKFSDSEGTSPSSIKEKRRINKSFINRLVHQNNWNQPIRHIESYSLTVLRYKR